MSTLYASFKDASVAERAAGALLDHGAMSADISVVANESYLTARGAAHQQDAAKAESDAKGGISTTTPGDVAIGATKGAAAGIGIGIAAALAALIVPGFGLVLGGGALAAALAGAAGTVAAGAAAGGVAGYLKDQGVPDEMVTRYSSTFYEGGSILAIAVPSGDMTAAEAEAILAKYGAINIATYNSPRVLAEGAVAPAKAPLIVENANPDIEPVVIVDRAAAHTTPVVETTHVTKMPDGSFVMSQDATLATPPISQVVIDPATGTQTVVPATPVGVPTSAVPVSQTTLLPNSEVVVDSTGVIHQTVGHPTVVNETAAVVIDPVTGKPHPATIVEEQRAVVANPTVIDASGRVIEGPTETTVIRQERVEIDEDHRR